MLGVISSGIAVSVSLIRLYYSVVKEGAKFKT
jgi:hypothetical protein